MVRLAAMSAAVSLICVSALAQTTPTLTVTLTLEQLDRLIRAEADDAISKEMTDRAKRSKDNAVDVYGLVKGAFWPNSASQRSGPAYSP